MRKNPKEKSITMDNIQPLCPVCGRELEKAKAADRSGWNCKCGEFVPKRLAINPFEGCTHGLNCNCGRERRR